MEPAVVLVHGAWCTPQMYQDVIDAIKDQGISDVHCPQLPSMTKTLPLPPTATYENDTSTIRSTVERLVEEERPVVLLMHSYGGTVGGNAIDGLLWTRRAAKGESGGVVHLVYVAAFVQPAGLSLTTPFNGDMPPWNYEDKDTGLM